MSAVTDSLRRALFNGSVARVGESPWRILTVLVPNCDPPRKNDVQQIMSIVAATPVVLPDGVGGALVRYALGERFDAVEWIILPLVEWLIRSGGEPGLATAAKLLTMKLDEAMPANEQCSRLKRLARRGETPDESIRQLAVQFERAGVADAYAAMVRLLDVPCGAARSRLASDEEPALILAWLDDREAKDFASVYRQLSTGKFLHEGAATDHRDGAMPIAQSDLDWALVNVQSPDRETIQRWQILASAEPLLQSVFSCWPRGMRFSKYRTGNRNREHGVRDAAILQLLVDPPPAVIPWLCDLIEAVDWAFPADKQSQPVLPLKDVLCLASTISIVPGEPSAAFRCSLAAVCLECMLGDFAQRRIGVRWQLDVLIADLEKKRIEMPYGTFSGLWASSNLIVSSSQDDSQRHCQCAKEIEGVARAWPRLPEHVRASILLLVQAAMG